MSDVTDICSKCKKHLRLKGTDIVITTSDPARLAARCPYCNGTHERVLSDTVTDLLLSNGAKVDWSDIRTVA